MIKASSLLIVCQTKVVLFLYPTVLFHFKLKYIRKNKYVGVYFMFNVTV